MSMCSDDLITFHYGSVVANYHSFQKIGPLAGHGHDQYLLPYSFGIGYSGRETISYYHCISCYNFSTDKNSLIFGSLCPLVPILLFPFSLGCIYCLNILTKYEIHQVIRAVSFDLLEAMVLIVKTVNCNAGQYQATITHITTYYCSY